MAKPLPLPALFVSGPLKKIPFFCDFPKAVSNRYICYIDEELLSWENKGTFPLFLRQMILEFTEDLSTLVEVKSRLYVLLCIRLSNKLFYSWPSRLRTPWARCPSWRSAWSCRRLLIWTERLVVLTNSSCLGSFLSSHFCSVFLSFFLSFSPLSLFLPLSFFSFLSVAFCQSRFFFYLSHCLSLFLFFSLSV